MSSTSLVSTECFDWREQIDSGRVVYGEGRRDAGWLRVYRRGKDVGVLGLELCDQS